MKLAERVALLAPVPEKHLESGVEKLNEEKPPFLAFGAGKLDKSETGPWRLREGFRQFDDDIDHPLVTMLIYPSMDEARPKPPYEVKWCGVYIGREDADPAGLFPGSDPWEYRPPTCEENYGYDHSKEEFVLYWKLQCLTELPEPLRIDIAILDGNRSQLWNNGPPPRPWPIGPERIEGTEWWPIRDFLNSIQNEA